MHYSGQGQVRSCEESIGAGIVSSRFVWKELDVIHCVVGYGMNDAMLAWNIDRFCVPT
jgi:hypothetical protein